MDKIGFTFGRSGFGFFHNGATDLFEAVRTREFLAEILTLGGPGGPLEGAEQRKAPHAGMGQQVTLNGAIGGTQGNRLNQLFSIVNGRPWIELIAQTPTDGLQRGFLLTTGTAFTADRAGVSTNRSALESLAENGTPVTFTLVADEVGKRVALDIDNNGPLEGDERERLSCGTASFDAADDFIFARSDADSLCMVVESQSSDTQVLVSPNRIQSGGAFNPVTLQSCAMPPPYVDPGGNTPECGDPLIDTSTDAGVFVWQECDGTWVVPMTGLVTDPDRGVRFVGSIASDAGFDAVTPLKMERSDTLGVQGTIPEFNATTGYPWEDRFSFRVADDAPLCVVRDERPSQLDSYIGPDRTDVGARFDPRNGDAC